MDWPSFGAGLAVGIYLGAGYKHLWQTLMHNIGWRSKARKLRLQKNVTNSPVLMAQAESPLHRCNWDTHLISFALNADLVGNLSERAVVSAGIVGGLGDYRVYQDLLVKAGAWQTRPRSRVRWATGWGVKRLRARLRRGTTAPPYPDHDPPPLTYKATRR
jgi:hypothetical protein